jgi:hypothetical protein
MAQQRSPGVPRPGETGGATFQPKKLYRTEEVLRATGLSRQVLYRYISLGLITPAEVTETGRRLFAENVFGTLDVIRDLNESGYSLRDIRETFFRRR